MAYIACSTPKNDGAIYAAVVESYRQNNKVRQRRIENLGRVIDLEKGIFKNRKLGRECNIFCVSPNNRL